MLYLSRHLLRGELRARQLLLIIIGIEALKFAVITPDWKFALVYSFSFCLLYAGADEFRRGTMPLTWQLRIKDLAYMVVALLVAGSIAWIVLDQDSRASRIADHTVDHFSYLVLHSDRIHRTHRESALLADTAAVFFAAGLGSILWILFRPYKLAALALPVPGASKILWSCIQTHPKITSKLCRQIGLLLESRRRRVHSLQGIRCNGLCFGRSDVCRRQTTSTR